MEHVKEEENNNNNNKNNNNNNNNNKKNNIQICRLPSLDEYKMQHRYFDFWLCFAGTELTGNQSPLVLVTKVGHQSGCGWGCIIHCSDDNTDTLVSLKILTLPRTVFSVQLGSNNPFAGSHDKERWGRHQVSDGRQLAESCTISWWARPP